MRTDLDDRLAGFRHTVASLGLPVHRERGGTGPSAALLRGRPSARSTRRPIMPAPTVAQMPHVVGAERKGYGDRSKRAETAIA